MPHSEARTASVRYTSVLFLLFTCGWAANHFTALLPVLADTGRFAAGSLEVTFGIYAAGLLPSLVLGGLFADRLNARAVSVSGAFIATGGNLVILLWPDELFVSVGRFIVGIGVGLAISAGSAWMSRLKAPDGAVLAGTLLTFGFGAGPLFGGIIAHFSRGSLSLILPILLTLSLSVIAATLVLLRGPTAGAVVVKAVASAPTPVSASESVPTPATPAQAVADGSAPVAPPGTPASTPVAIPAPSGSILRALAWSVPMALWVFSCATVPMVVLPARLNGGFDGPLAAGVLSLVTLGTSVTVQAIARRRQWGMRSGVAGALLAALGFTLAALISEQVTLLPVFVCAVVFGASYGLSLRNGLGDIERLAPAASRGITVGIFYVGAYLGFGLPRLLEGFRTTTGIAMPLFVIAAIAVAAALLRVVQMRGALKRP